MAKKKKRTTEVVRRSTGSLHGPVGIVENVLGPFCHRICGPKTAALCKWESTCMKSLHLSAILFAAVLTAHLACPDASKAQFGPRGPRVISPEISEGKVSFRVLAPEAESVKLSGTDMPGVGQGMDMAKGSEGIWEVTLGLAPGYYRYNFHIGGVPVIDPREPCHQ